MKPAPAPGRLPLLAVLLAVVAAPLAAVAAPVVGATTAAPAHAEFADSIVRVDSSGVAEVGITVPDGANDSVRVTVGSDGAGFLASATVTDADDDGSAVLRLDAGSAGNGDPGSYLSVSRGDELGGARQASPAGSQPLDGGDYDLSLGPPADPVDVATLVVEGGTGVPNEVGSTTAGTTAEPTTRSARGTTLVYRGEVLSLAAAPGQEIHGETRLPAGTALTIRLRSTGESPFLKAVETTVDRYGTFEVTLDLSDVEPGTSFSIVVRGDGTELFAGRGRVVDCEGGCPTTTEVDRSETGDLPADEVAVAPVVEVVRGRTARIPVTMGDAEAVTVSIGGPGVNYVVNGTVPDRDGDGRAVVLFDTASAGLDGRTLGAYDDGDPWTVEATAETELTTLLAPGTYPVRVYRGTAAEGEPAATGSVVVHEIPPLTTTETPPPTTATATTSLLAGNETTGGGLLAGRAGGLGAVAVGGALALAGVVVVLGLHRSRAG